MSDTTPRPPGPPRPEPRRFEDQPTGAVPVERKPGSMSRGLRNTLIVIGAVVVAATLSALFGFFVLADKAEKESDEMFGSSDCSYISDGDLSEAVGTQVDAFQLGTAGDFATAIADNRVEVDGVSCLATGDADVSVSMTKAEDDAAADLFQSQLTSAKADDGGGTPLYAQDVTGLGDEAFCTTADMIGSTGVLTRSGDTLVYASVAAPTLATTPEAACALAAEAARAVVD